MKRKSIAIVIAAIFGAGLYAAELEEKNVTKKSFAMGAGSRKLIVDEINGRVHITGYSGSNVEVTVSETWRADSPEKMQQARRDVTLDLGQQGNTVRLYVDGPFRGKGPQEHGRRGYEVTFDFDIQVPNDAELELRTVNGGERVENTRGNFDVHSVNGGIEMKDVGGSGSVQTVNGGVNVAFAEVPRTECSFKSVNGGLTVKFPPSLSADIRMKTVNGQAFTDFESTTLPNAEGLAERKGNMFVYRSNRAVGIRVGGGGVEHKFETVNGSIRILK
jgi:DUF4097 and DUF4098 domain-containing protein YvlB